MDNHVNGKGMPLGFGLALVQNPRAMDKFSSLSEKERQSILSGCKNVRSRQEMQAYVESITNFSM